MVRSIESGISKLIFEIKLIGFIIKCFKPSSLISLTVINGFNLSMATDFFLPYYVTQRQLILSKGNTFSIYYNVTHFTMDSIVWHYFYHFPFRLLYQIDPSSSKFISFINFIGVT